MVRHFPAIQDLLNRNILRNGFRIPGPGDVADGLTNHKSDIFLFLTVLAKGSSRLRNPLSPYPSRDASSRVG